MSDVEERGGIIAFTEAAREQIRELQRSSTDQPATADARLKARDEHIAELEEQFRDLTQRHRELSGELHTAQLDITSAQQECDSWKNKCQRVNDALDE